MSYVRGGDDRSVQDGRSRFRRLLGIEVPGGSFAPGESLGSSRGAAMQPAERGPREPWRSVWRQRVVLLAADGHRIPCVFLTPEREGRWDAAVVAIHQHNGEFQWGKSEPVGEAGNRQLSYALRVAQRGIPVIAPDLQGFEERQTDPSDGARAEQLDAWNRVTRGETLLGLHVGDVGVVVSWLRDLAEVQGPIGLIGHSLGGQVALATLACDPRVSAAVVSCGAATLEAFERERILHNPSVYVPGLREAGDLFTVAEAVADQRVLVVAGRRDPLFPFAAVESLVASFGEGVCEFVPLDGGHEFPPAAQDSAVDWLLNELRP